MSLFYLSLVAKTASFIFFSPSFFDVVRLQLFLVKLTHFSIYDLHTNEAMFFAYELSS